jgi:hypothetical protein
MAESELDYATTMRIVRFGDRWRLWNVLDVLGLRSAKGRWIDDLASTGIPIRFVYAEGDLGIRHLYGRFGRRIRKVTQRGNIVVDEIAGIDHQMHREWLRGVVSQRLLEFAREIDANRVTARPNEIVTL